MAKIIKSSQVGCETPAVSCSCGGSCFGMEHGNAYNWLENEYYCEDCNQVWAFPKNMYMVVKFKKEVA